MPSIAKRRPRPIFAAKSVNGGRRTARKTANAVASTPGADDAQTERDTLQLRVYRALARGLMAGRFRPGEAVTLRTLAARLGTSAMPVREAIGRLIAERALIMLANRSVIVPRMTRDRFIELSRVRQALEGMATDAACAHATPALVKELARINDSLKRSLAADDFHAALSHNVAFHFTLYEAGKTAVLLRLIETLWLQAGPFLALSVAMPNMRWTARHHNGLLAALRASNAKAARQAIEADIEETLQELLARAEFEGEGARGMPSRAGRPRRLASVITA